MENNESFIPYVGKIIDIRQETPDVKTFSVVGLDGKKLFEHIPGQCAMLIVPGVGESMQARRSMWLVHKRISADRRPTSLVALSLRRSIAKVQNLRHDPRIEPLQNLKRGVVWREVARKFGNKR